MLTFIFGYYAERNNQKEIFEDNQHDFEQATETLSQYLEQELTTDNVDEVIQQVKFRSRWV